MAKKGARARLKMQFGKTSLGPGKVMLLEAIAAEGSISAAARSMGMSYRRAWYLINTLQAALNEPVLDTETGGKNKGGASLTTLGKELVRHYRQAEKRTAKGTEGLSALLDKNAS